MLKGNDVSGGEHAWQGTPVHIPTDAAGQAVLPAPHQLEHLCCRKGAHHSFQGRTRMTSLELIKNTPAGGQDEYCIRLTPPQTNDIPNFRVGRGAYLFVIDVSGRCPRALPFPTKAERPRGWCWRVCVGSRGGVEGGRHLTCGDPGLPPTLPPPTAPSLLSPLTGSHVCLACAA